jgi:hypothetical protein
MTQFMTSLTLEDRAYKEKTVEQLLQNFKVLEQRLVQERRVEIIQSIQEQLEEIQAHIARLQQELATNTAGEPVADNLYRRVATALTTNKFYLAKKLLHKLETIEPFYPNIDRLRTEAETGRASRRTQSISKGGALPEVVLSPEMAEAAAAAAAQTSIAVSLPNDEVIEVIPEKKGLAQLFQFHIIASCLVVSLILCVMFGVGGITALQWLIEGN